MPVSYADYKRDGMTTMLELGKALCKLVLAFAPIIRGKYSGNTAIIALLIAVENLCPLIGDAETEFNSLETDDLVPPVDGDVPDGIDVGAPPSGDPSGII